MSSQASPRNIPGWMRSGALEYRHRYLLHALIYSLGFAAPWHWPPWSFVHNQSTWFWLANKASLPTFEHFARYWNLLLVAAALFALAGAVVRTWGAAYLGASTVHRGNMEGQRVIADGPYRFLRNPLYLGTILNTIAVAILMRPEAAALTILLITAVQFRLIAREESFLGEQLGPAYEAYRASVPRMLPSLGTRTVSSGEKPNWLQGILSEIYVIGCAISFAALGWTTGYSWETNVIRVLQGIVISLGISLAARAFIPKSQI